MPERKGNEDDGEGKSSSLAPLYSAEEGTIDVPKPASVLALEASLGKTLNPYYAHQATPHEGQGYDYGPPIGYAYDNGKNQNVLFDTSGNYQTTQNQRTVAQDLVPLISLFAMPLMPMAGAYIGESLVSAGVLTSAADAAFAAAAVEGATQASIAAAGTAATATANIVGTAIANTTLQVALGKPVGEAVLSGVAGATIGIYSPAATKALTEVMGHPEIASAIVKAGGSAAQTIVAGGNADAIKNAFVGSLVSTATTNLVTNAFNTAMPDLNPRTAQVIGAATSGAINDGPKGALTSAVTTLGEQFIQDAQKAAKTKTGGGGDVAAEDTGGGGLGGDVAALATSQISALDSVGGGRGNINPATRYVPVQNVDADNPLAITASDALSAAIGRDGVPSGADITPVYLATENDPEAPGGIAFTWYTDVSITNADGTITGYRVKYDPVTEKTFYESHYTDNGNPVTVVSQKPPTYDVNTGSFTAKPGDTTSGLGSAGTQDVEAITSSPIDVLNTQDVEAITSSPIDVLNTQDVEAITSSPIDVLNTQDVEAITSSPIDVLNTQDVEAITSSPIDVLTTQDIAALTSSPIDVLNTQAAEAITSSPIDVLTTQDIAALTSSPIDVLNTQETKALASSPIDVLNTQETKALASSPIDVLNTQETKALASSPIGALTTQDIAALTSSPIDALNTTGSALSSQMIGALTTQDIAGLSTQNLSGLSTQNLSGLSTQNLSGLSTQNIVGLGTENLSGLGTRGVSGLGTEVVSGLSTQNIVGLGTENLSGLGTEVVSGLSTKDIKALTTEDLTRLSTKDITVLTTKAPTVLTTKAPTVLTTEDLTGLSTKDITVLTTKAPTVLTTKAPTVLTTEDLTGLSTKDITTLTTKDLTGLSTKDITTLTTVPVRVLVTSPVNTLTTTPVGALPTNNPATFADASLIPGNVLKLGKMGSSDMGYNQNLKQLSVPELKDLAAMQNETLSNVDINKALSLLSMYAPDAEKDVIPQFFSGGGQPDVSSLVNAYSQEDLQTALKKLSNIDTGLTSVNPQPLVIKRMGATSERQPLRQLQVIPQLAEILQARGMRMAQGGQPDHTHPHYDGTPLFRTGGLESLGGKYVEGKGDGTSDDIAAMLANGEYVFSADVVAALGNGSNKAGAEELDQMVRSIRARARSAPPDKLPPDAKSPLEYLKSSKGKKHD